MAQHLPPVYAKLLDALSLQIPKPAGFSLDRRWCHSTEAEANMPRDSQLAVGRPRVSFVVSDDTDVANAIKAREAQQGHYRTPAALVYFGPVGLPLLVMYDAMSGVTTTERG